MSKDPYKLFGSSILTTPGVQANTVHAINPADFSMTYSSTPAPGANVHLTLPLSKPMHHYNENELLGLVSELEADGFLQQEESIARIVDEAYMAWLGQRGSPGYTSRPFTTHAVPMNTVAHISNTSPAMVSTHKRITIHVPQSVPQPYIRAFIERSVRDQIEEG